MVQTQTKFGQDLIYYYCSADTFRSIVVDAQLWLTDSRVMNDQQECLFIELFLKKYKDCLDTSGQNAVGDFLANKLQEPRFLCCFSRDKDKLSQWRGYADNARGYAIGLDQSLLMEIIDYNKYPYDVDNIKYYATPNENSDDNMYDTNSRKPKDNISILNEIKKACKEDSLTALSMKTKHMAFIEEKESRLMCGKSDESQWKFTCIRGGLYPHLELNFSNKREVIKEIILGPCNKSVKEDVQNFLNQQKYSHVSVEYSQARQHFTNTSI